MVLLSKYNSYISSNRELHDLMGGGCCAKDNDSFEEVYKKAKDINPEDAKEFLRSLSSEEMESIRQYQSLADAVNIDTLSDEGSANLLLHRYEQIDFNDDGLTEVGLAKTFGLFNQNMPQEFRDTVLSALKEMKKSSSGESGLFSVVSALSFRFNAPLSQFDYSFDGVKSMIDEINSPDYKGYMASELKDSLNLFFEHFESAWNKAGYDKSGGESDPEVERFLKELVEKGAAAFLQKLNEEKIQKLIKDKKAELEEKYGLNANPPLEGKAKQDALEAMNKELEEFTKELYERLNKRAKAKKEEELNLRELLRA